MSSRKRVTDTNVHQLAGPKKGRHGPHSLGTDSEKEAEVGIIEKISALNFSCFEKLDYCFGPNVNYIGGRNGSGKSSLLACIIFGLGGKAVVTSRGNSIKELIRDGQPSARVEIHLRNRGTDAFKPDEYGETICVERTVCKLGKGGYKIKSEHGKLVSCRKSELTNILEHFNIQVTNPMSILTQPQSREFLVSANPKAKYAFFMKATQLDLVQECNDDAREKLQIAKDLILRKEDTLPGLEREMEELKERSNYLEKAQSLKDKILDLKRELYWAMLRDKKEKSEALLQSYQMQSNEYRRLMRDFSANELAIEEKENELAQLADQHRLMLVKVDGSNQDLENLNREIATTEELKTSYKEEINKLAVPILQTFREKQNLQTEIAQAMENVTGTTLGNHVNRTESIQQLEKQKEELQVDVKSIEVHLKEQQNLVSQLSDTVEERKNESKLIEREICTLERKIHDLEGSQNGLLQHFGRYMPFLIDKIRLACHEGRFRKEPIGPIGAFIKLKDKKWALAVESCLGFFLSSFCCDNYEDEKVLRQLIDVTVQEGKKPSIVTSPFPSVVYDVTKYGVAHPSYPSLFDVLVFDSPIVANCLIDQKKIDTILLIEDKAEARQTMTYSVPKNCSETYTIEGDHVFPMPCFRYYTNANKVSNFFQNSVGGRIKNLEEHLATLKLDLEKCEHSRSSAIDKFVQSKNKWEVLQKHLSDTTQAIVRTNHELEELLNFVETEQTDISVLNEDLKQIEESLANMTNKVKEYKQNAKEAKAKQLELLSQQNQHKIKHATQLLTAENISEQLETVGAEITVAKTKNEDLKLKLNDKKKEADAGKSLWYETQSEIQSAMEKSDVVGECIDTLRACKDIETEILTISAVIEEIGNLDLNEEEVKAKYCQCQATYNRIKSEMKMCSDMIEMLEIGVQKRQKLFEHFRTQLSIRIKNLFNSNLCVNRFEGSIMFDHKNRTLRINARSIDDPKLPEKNTICLSGGEKSFTTVLFLISLWEMMESPFHAMDEWEIFMDLVIREKVLKILVKMAISRKQNQFILLSPYLPPVMPPSPFIKIKTLQDPRRCHEQSEEEESDV